MKNTNDIFKNSPFGYALHSIVLDETGNPIDYTFIEVNEAFEKLTGLNKNDILGKTAKEVIPGIDKSNFDWINCYGRVAIDGKAEIFEQFSEPLGKYYSVQAYSPEKGFFAVIFTDITVRKLEEDEIKKTKNQFKSLVENIPGITYRCKLDKDWTMIFMSDAVEVLTGYPAIDFINNAVRTYGSIIHPDDVEYVAHSVYNAVDNDNSWNIEYRINNKDASIRWVQEKGRVLYSEDGNSYDLDGFILDITTQKNYEFRIAENEDRLARAIAGTGAGLWDWDMVKNTVFFSSRWKGMLGYEDHEVRNDFSGWKNLWHPEDAPRIEGALKDFLDGNTKVYEIEHRLRHKDGSWHWISTRGDITKDSTGKPIRWTGTNIDITDHKKAEVDLSLSEAKFRQLVENTNDIIYSLTSSGYFTFVSPSWTRLLGYDAIEVEGHLFSEFVNTEDLSSCNVFLRKVLDTGERQDGVEYRVKHKNGEWRWHTSSANPVKDSSGLVIGFDGLARDINDRKRAEESWIKSDLLLKKLSAQLPGVIYQYQINPDGKACFPFASEHIKEIYEVLPDEVVEDASRVMDRLHPDDFNRVVQKILESKDSLTKWEDEYRVILPRKGERWIRGIANPEKLEDGSVLWHGYIFDITENKKNQFETERIKEQFELAIAGTNDGIWDWNILTNELFLSKRWKAILGYEDHEMTNEFNSFIALLYDNDVSRVNDFVQSYLKGEIEKYCLEFRMKHKNNSLVWILAKGEALRDPFGIPYRMAGSHSDISERKEIEEKLRENQIRLQLAMDAGEHGFWDWNLVTNNTYFSPNYFTMLGYEDKELPMSLDTFMKLIHPDDAEKVMPTVQQSIESGRPYEVEFRLQCKDGSFKWIMGKGKAYLDDESGKPNRAVGVHVDINERKIAEEKLKIAKEQAESASKAKSEFLANMSHEIRTPLNGVIGFTDLLKNTPLSSVQQKYVENANISGHTLLAIINDILDFSKIEAGMLHLEMIKTDMVELLENSLDIVKYSAGKKGLELLLNIDVKMPRLAVTDPIRLKQIFANLLSNAVKFTEKGEVELKIEYFGLGGNNGRFCFVVRDTGIGISEEQKQKLFKAFSQADSSTTRKFGGTGLGLIISDMIAQKFGSKIHIESKHGEGTSFFFNIITETEEANDIKYSSIDLIKRCLIIDDNDKNCVILEQMLVKWNIISESCNNSLTAMKLLETSKPFDIIICDYHMPYIDGLETIRLIREKMIIKPDKQDIILLYAPSDDEEFHTKCDELGVKFKLMKPVKVDDLYSCLKQIHVQEQKEIKLTDSDIPELNIQGDKIKILVAEDVEMNMMMIKAVLNNIISNVQIIEATDGLEAFEKYKIELPDLVFMDVQMPEVDGLFATVEIRKTEQEKGTHIPIIALTAGAFKEEQDKCLAAGMDDFLTKPVEPEKIKFVLNKYLGIALKCLKPLI